MTKAKGDQGAMPGKNGGTKQIWMAAMAVMATVLIASFTGLVGYGGVTNEVENNTKQIDIQKLSLRVVESETASLDVLMNLVQARTDSVNMSQNRRLLTMEQDRKNDANDLAGINVKQAVIVEKLDTVNKSLEDLEGSVSQILNFLRPTPPRFDQ